MEIGIPVPARLSLDFQQELVEHIDQIYYLNSLIRNETSNIGENAIDLLRRDGPLLVKRYRKICFYKMSHFLDQIPQYPLNEAAGVGDVEVLKALVSAGFDPHVSNMDILVAGCQCEPPILSAVRAQRFDAICYLVECLGCDVNSVDEYSSTPLHSAAFCGDLSLVKYLVEQGANVNALDDWNSTPLFGALKHHNICKYLIANEANVHITDSLGNYLVTYAFSVCESVETARLLISETSSTVSNDLKNSLHIAANRGWLDLMKLLNEYEADAEEVNENGETPLHILARNRNTTCARYLLVELCVHADRKNSKGQTPFAIAVEESNVPFINLLLDVGYELCMDDIRCVEPEGDPEMSEVLNRAKQVVSSPRSLQNLCCLTIRHYLGRKVQSNVLRLGLPTLLTDLIQLNHVLPVEG